MSHVLGVCGRRLDVPGQLAHSMLLCRTSLLLSLSSGLRPWRQSQRLLHDYCSCCLGHYHPSNSIFASLAGLCCVQLRLSMLCRSQTPNTTPFLPLASLCTPMQGLMPQQDSFRCFASTLQSLLESVLCNAGTKLLIVRRTLSPQQKHLCQLPVSVRDQGQF